MTFLSGLVTGLATSVDDVLKKDMERTQERVDGMAQYRVTRRRAALEAQEKEKKEIQDSINKLASLVGGDVDKAAQLYVSGGQTVDGANDLYKELKTNADAGKDINAVLTFADVAETGQITDYLKQFVTPISTLPVSKDEAPGAGLYGALFKPDTQKMVQRQVAEAAPIPDQTKRAMGITGATIDRSKMLAAEEYKDVVTGRERETKRFEMEIKSFDTQQKQAAASMRQADERLDLAKKEFERTGDNIAWNRAKDMHSMTIADEQLKLAVAREGRAAEEFLLSQDLTELGIREKRLTIEKLERAPEYATYEAMLVASDQELAKLEAKTTKGPEDLRRIEILQATMKRALDGINAYEQAQETDEATGYIPEFSKQSLDSIYNNEIKRQLEPVGLIKDIEGEITYMIDGNEPQYIQKMSNAINNMQRRFAGASDSIGLNNFLAAQQASLQETADTYKAKKLTTEGFTAKSIDRSPNILQAVKSQNYDPNDPVDVILEGINQGKYKTGDIIQYTDSNGVTQHVLYTGNDLF
tara:strand:+ start:1018 stop:2601 length:1584 start_codon:yes stop_codon:yes gene_type:complete